MATNEEGPKHGKPFKQWTEMTTLEMMFYSGCIHTVCLFIGVICFIAGIVLMATGCPSPAPEGFLTTSTRQIQRRTLCTVGPILFAASLFLLGLGVYSCIRMTKREKRQIAMNRQAVENANAQPIVSGLPPNQIPLGMVQHSSALPSSTPPYSATSSDFPPTIVYAYPADNPAFSHGCYDIQTSGSPDFGCTSDSYSASCDNGGSTAADIGCSTSCDTGCGTSGNF